jgi:hypothetical protein
MNKHALFGTCLLLYIALPAVAQPPVYLASASTPRWFPVVQPTITRPAGRIHVLLVGDTNDSSIGHSTEVDLQNLANLFRELVPIPSQLEMQTIRGNDVSKENILRTISTFHPAADDAFVFIWTGHGAYNSIGHYFGMPNGEGLYRADVVAAMRLLGPRLVVVLSGSCNEASQANVQWEYRSHCCFHPTLHEKPQRISPIAEELFLGPRGVVDINGASEGQLGFANNERGCSFLCPLACYLRENSERRVCWATLVNEVSPRVQEFVNEVAPKGYFHEANKKLYTQQTPKVWTLPDDNRGPRFGVGATNNDGDGVRVVQVWSGFPSTRLVCLETGQRWVLEPNDVILTINGQPIRCVHEYARAMDASPQQVQLAVRDWRTGQIGVLSTMLLY